MAANDTIFREHGLLPWLHTDLRVSDASTAQKNPEGAIAWMRDGFSNLRLFTYRKNVSGSAFALGDLVSRFDEDEANQTGTTTTSVTGSTTADDHIGALAIVYDDAGAAGGAPEGEASVVASNTATVWTFETDLPLSTAVAANDDVYFISPKVI